MANGDPIKDLFQSVKSTGLFIDEQDLRDQLSKDPQSVFSFVSKNDATKNLFLDYDDFSSMLQLNGQAVKKKESQTSLSPFTKGALDASKDISKGPVQKRLNQEAIESEASTLKSPLKSDSVKTATSLEETGMFTVKESKVKGIPAYRLIKEQPEQTYSINFNGQELPVSINRLPSQYPKTKEGLDRYSNDLLKRIENTKGTDSYKTNYEELMKFVLLSKLDKSSSSLNESDINKILAITNLENGVDAVINELKKRKSNIKPNFKEGISRQEAMDYVEIPELINKVSRASQTEVKKEQAALVIGANTRSALQSTLGVGDYDKENLDDRVRIEQLGNEFFTGLEALKYSDKTKYDNVYKRLTERKSLASTEVAAITKQGADIIDTRNLELLDRGEINIDEYIERAKKTQQASEDNFYKRQDILQYNIAKIVAEYYAPDGTAVFGKWFVSDREIDAVPKELFEQAGIDITRPESQRALKNIKKNEGVLPFDNAIAKDSFLRELSKGIGTNIEGVTSTLGGIGKPDEEKYIERQLEPLTNYTKQRTQYFDEKYHYLADALNGAGQFMSQIMLMRGGASIFRSLGATNKAADLYSIIGTSYLQSYDSHYKDALERTNNPLAAKVMGFTNASMEGLSETMFNNLAFARSVAKNLRGAIDYKQVAKVFEKGVFNEAAQAEFKDILSKGIIKAIDVSKKTFGGLVQESFEEVPVQFSDFVTTALVNPDAIRHRELFPELKDAFVQGMVSFSIPALIGGAASIKNQFSNPLQESALLAAAMNRNSVLDALNNFYEDGHITADEWNTKVKILNTAAKSLTEIPSHADGSRMSMQEAEKYLALTVREKFLKEQIGKTDDEAIKKSTEERINEISQQKLDIINAKVPQEQEEVVELTEQEVAAIEGIANKDLSGTVFERQWKVISDEGTSPEQKRSALKEISDQLTATGTEERTGLLLGKEADLIYDLGYPGRDESHITEAQQSPLDQLTPQQLQARRAQLQNALQGELSEEDKAIVQQELDDVNARIVATQPAEGISKPIELSTKLPGEEGYKPLELSEQTPQGELKKPNVVGQQPSAVSEPEAEINEGSEVTYNGQPYTVTDVFETPQGGVVYGLKDREGNQLVSESGRKKYVAENQITAVSNEEKVSEGAKNISERLNVSEETAARIQELKSQYQEQIKGKTKEERDEIAKQFIQQIRNLGVSEADFVTTSVDLSGIDQKDYNAVRQKVSESQSAERVEMMTAAQATIPDALSKIEKEKGVTTENVFDETIPAEASIYDVMTGENYTDEQRGIAAAYMVAQRVLYGPENDFITKLFNRASNPDNRIRIINSADPQFPSVSVDSNGTLTINANKLGKQLKQFGGEGRFMNWLENALNEEIIHLATFKVTNEAELNQIADEMTADQKQAVQDLYAGRLRTKEMAKPFLAAEYLRMVVQERMNGVTTELLRPPAARSIVKDILSKLVTFIKNTFAGQQNSKANEVVKRIEDYISGKENVPKPKISIEDRPEGESPVYKVEHGGKEYFVQRATNVDGVSGWYEVEKINNIWQPIQDGKFDPGHIGWTQAEALRTIVNRGETIRLGAAEDLSDDELRDFLNEGDKPRVRVQATGFVPKGPGPDFGRVSNLPIEADPVQQFTLSFHDNVITQEVMKTHEKRDSGYVANPTDYERNEIAMKAMAMEMDDLVANILSTTEMDKSLEYFTSKLSDASTPLWVRNLLINSIGRNLRGRPDILNELRTKIDTKLATESTISLSSRRDWFSDPSSSEAQVDDIMNATEEGKEILDTKKKLDDTLGTNEVEEEVEQEMADRTIDDVKKDIAEHEKKPKKTERKKVKLTESKKKEYHAKAQMAEQRLATNNNNSKKQQIIDKIKKIIAEC